MNTLLRGSLVALVCGIGMSAASDADARDCFLKKIFNRGNDCCCNPCEPVCCEPAPQPCCCAPVSHCGCDGYATQSSYGYSDCGCGTVTSGEVVVEDSNSNQPTEAASPSDEMPEVPEPPAAEEAGEEATEEAAEATTEA